MMIWITKIKKVVFTFFVYLILFNSPASSQIFNEIRVIGNERLSVETIIMFSGLKIGEEINNKELNLSIKIIKKVCSEY